MGVTSFTYAVGYVHGSLRLLRTLIKRCRRHARNRAMTWVFLGDYIDRGPDSAGVVRFIMDLQSEGRERLIALKGNREAMVIDVIDGEVEAEFWLGKGGAQTLPSYGVTGADAPPRGHVRCCGRCQRHRHRRGIWRRVDGSGFQRCGNQSGHVYPG
jgi:serine/threonine protein phosphatase 1